MKNYRLKKEAVQFFDEKYATAIYPLDIWRKNGLDENALNEVEDPYIKYGHCTSESSTTLSGWDKEKGSRFHFTIYFPSTSYKENDEFSNGKMTRELMNKIQNQINYFQRDFSNKGLENH